MNKKQAFNTTKNTLIQHSFNKVYGSNTISVVNKSEPKAIQYILTSNFIFDLSCLGTLRLEKNVIKEAFKKNVCREFTDNCEIQTVQAVLHCSNRNTVASSKKVKKSTASEKNKTQVPQEKRTVGQTYGELSLFLPYNLDSGRHLNKQVKDSTQVRAQFPLKMAKTANVEIIEKISHLPRLEQIYPLFSKCLSSTFAPAIINKKWINNSRIFKGTQFFGGNLMRADWVLNKLIEQLNQSGKRSPRPIVKQFINDIRVLMDQMGSASPIIGMRITITGRLGSRKKAMAQQITKCVGKVPLSTFRQKVDYSQGFLPTRFGKVGVKVWVTFSNNNPL